MHMAIALGFRNLGNTGANPSVGCVIVKDGQIVGRGVTAKGGRPHAETIALEMAGKNAKGATVYLTLEPCAHHGGTPPCTEALIKAGVEKVIFALQDPDPRVNGNGAAQLKAAGIEIQSGVCEEEAKALHAGFITRVVLGRPYITLKLATSLDGRIALSNRVSKWISNERSRQYVHRLRAINDAVMVGTNTVLHDDPELTCRLEGLEDRSPIRIVLDSKGRIGANAKVFNKAAPTLIFTARNAKIAQPIDNKTIFYLDAGKDGILPPQDVCHALSKNGINRLLIEGGSMLAASFLQARLVDELVWVQSPRILGGDGLPAVGNLSINTLGETHGFRIQHTANLEGDCILTLKKTAISAS